MNVLDQCQTVIVQLPKNSIVYEWLFGIHEFYRPIHTYVSIVLCILGALCNFCNIVVLTRKQMRTPVNMILTAMACCDTIVLFSNLIYTTHYTFVAFANCHPRHWSYGWAMFLIAHAHLSLVGHSSSIWLSVMLALIRYLTLRRRGKMTGIQIDLKHSYVAIASVIVFVSVMNAPNFLTYKIMEMGLNETCIITDESVRYASAYVPGVSDLAVEADCLVFRMAFWISGTIFKMLPCVLLTFLVSLLTRILKEVKENQQRLLLRGASHIGSNVNSNTSTAATATATSTTNIGAIPAISALAFNGEMAAIAEEKRRHSSFEFLQSPTPSSPTLFDSNNLKHKFSHIVVKAPNSIVVPTLQPDHPISRSSSVKLPVSGILCARQNRADRTTRMLLAIVCVFLITELPQGIMAVLSGMFSEEFRRYIYNNLGDILDLLSLCGACTSFIIYCSMSGQFRNEFRRVFVPARLKRWFTSDHSPSSCRNTQTCCRCSDAFINYSKSGEITNNKSALDQQLNRCTKISTNSATSFMRFAMLFKSKRNCSIGLRLQNSFKKSTQKLTQKRSSENSVRKSEENNGIRSTRTTPLALRKTSNSACCLSNSVVDVPNYILFNNVNKTINENNQKLDKGLGFKESLTTAFCHSSSLFLKKVNTDSYKNDAKFLHSDVDHFQTTRADLSDFLSPNSQSNSPLIMCTKQKEKCHYAFDSAEKDSFKLIPPSTVLSNEKMGNKVIPNKLLTKTSAIHLVNNGSKTVNDSIEIRKLLENDFSNSVVCNYLIDKGIHEKVSVESICKFYANENCQKNCENEDDEDDFLNCTNFLASNDESRIDFEIENEDEYEQNINEFQYNRNYINLNNINELPLFNDSSITEI